MVGARLSERSRKLIPETRQGMLKGTLSDDVGGRVRVTRAEERVLRAG